MKCLVSPTTGLHFGSSGPCSLNGSWTALCCIVYSGYKLWRFCAAFGPSQEEGHVLGPLLPESWDLVQCNGSVSVIELYIAFTVMYFVNGQPSFLIAMATHFSLLTIMEVRHCAFLRSSLALLCLILRPFGFVFESCLNHRDVCQVVRLTHLIQTFLTPVLVSLLMPVLLFCSNLKPSISGLRWHSTTHPAVKKTARALFLSRFRGGSDTLGLAEMVGRWMNVDEWICLSRKLVI